MPIYTRKKLRGGKGKKLRSCEGDTNSYSHTTLSPLNTGPPELPDYKMRLRLVKWEATHLR